MEPIELYTQIPYFRNYDVFCTSVAPAGLPEIWSLFDAGVLHHRFLKLAQSLPDKVIPEDESIVRGDLQVRKDFLELLHRPVANSDAERHSLFLALIEILLRDKRLVLAVPDPQRPGWQRDANGKYRVWCVNAPEAMAYFREYVENRNQEHPYPPVAWLGRGARKGAFTPADAETLMTLSANGERFAEVTDWEWIYHQQSPSQA
ncbi:hypothetical protein [Acidithiobacillus caldus]|nr:hypothetical protein [Acidithiobacillus caldus]MBU2771342.1 hypothetical protein [Acidithiobacillus caldus]